MWFLCEGEKMVIKVEHFYTDALKENIRENWKVFIEIHESIYDTLWKLTTVAHFKNSLFCQVGAMWPKFSTIEGVFQVPHLY